MAEAHPLTRQLHFNGFGTFLQSRGDPEDLLERARAFGHVALVLACRSPAPANENGTEPWPAENDPGISVDGAGRG